jgi:protein-S-isoprenylcysteine O-methyltransferase Ste14
MWIFVILGALWIGIFIFWLIPMIQQRIIYEIFEAAGLGGFLTLLILGLGGFITHYDIRILRIIGFILYAPTAFFVIPTFAILKHKGKPKSGWEHTTIMINSSIFRIVRHPLYLGTALWTMALMLIFQSLSATILGIAVIGCCWMASKKEDEFNINKFGNDYLEYMKEVPRWNAIKGLLQLAKKH